MRSWPRNTNGNANRGHGWRRGSDGRHSNGRPNESNRPDKSPFKSRNYIEETPEQVQAKTDYNGWKRTLKTLPDWRDAQIAKTLWEGALEILNGTEREWKHRLARDLDDEDLYGREHIQETITGVIKAKHSIISYHAMSYFLQAMTHASILDCLSIDTCVGGLYNFFSGTNGGRAIPALQSFCDRVLEECSGIPDERCTDVELAAVALSTALRELLKREQRARLHDDLPPLIDSLEGLSTSLEQRGLLGTSSQLAHHIGEIRAVVDRARGLLSLDDADAADFAGAPAPAYPRGLQIPNGRHDNDKSDIVAMNIFPTRAEILSEVAEFLPSTDPEQPHFLTDKSQRHIDTLFRLLRQDTFGELKEVLSNTLRLSEMDRTYLESPRLSFGNLRANRYSKAVISYISFNSRRGLEISISFSQPQILRGKSVSERQRWWEDSRRLSEGVLVSFIAMDSDRAQNLFLIISNRKLDNDEEDGRTKSVHHATIRSRLASQNEEDIETLMGLSSSKVHGVLVEFPGVIPDTFIPILENLQNMQRLGSLPFQNWILPDKIEQGDGSTTSNIPPPRYARKPGFAFSLKPIMRSGSNEDANTCIEPDSIVNNEELVSKVEAETDLDRGQCQSLIAALSREFALIQGPPGTGKSYLGIKLMKVLLNHQREAALGPIVVVCYTNHALDQFLEHILHDGTKRIIRIGGQCHSKILEGHNLRTASQLESKSGSERFFLAQAYQELEKKTESIKKILGRAHGSLRQIKWEYMERYLTRHYSRIARQFRVIDDEGFQVVGQHPFDNWASCKTVAEDLNGNQQVAIEFNRADVLRRASVDVYALNLLERKQVINFWSTEMYKQAVDDLLESIKDVASTQRDVSNIHDEVDRRVLQEADVIGITTAGLAKRVLILQRLRCKVVICEEAGEVMEPHMLAALLPTVEHIIQIGDHEQLRPQINNFGLSLESKQGVLYQLDRSQFERLSVGIPGRPKIPVAQLEVQRRMRPSISLLIRETLYPNIQDHASTHDHPDVVGMRKNLFWLDHDNIEDGRLRALMRSDFEIVLSERDRDLLEQDGFDLASLSSGEELPDGGPGHRKGALAKKKLSELLRVATVDNFQGEEAKVIIVSLVRSNAARKVGFLKTTNRINVLLSRAQHGMYLIGNTETYANVKMWQTVIDLMRALTTSLDTALKEDVRKPAFGASPTAATCASHDAIRKACTEYFRARNLASGYMSRADMDVRSQLAERTAASVLWS
ncbi:hypothetical protein NQ176_g3576 [Zarea fungicola]|uniref:Uncharacterized protein n=1 Tax=Zarea fungicola TaxID=93591 RepID=A0ACC1NHX7_9HYPO|nr:hypothetical protein NQ176_g3576 [Lecanicillium fungicola]